MRTYTNKLINLLDEGIIDPSYLCLELLNWLSESEVSEFWERNYSEFDEQEEEE